MSVTVIREHASTPVRKRYETTVVVAIKDATHSVNDPGLVERTWAEAAQTIGKQFVRLFGRLQGVVLRHPRKVMERKSGKGSNG